MCKVSDWRCLHKLNEANLWTGRYVLYTKKKRSSQRRVHCKPRPKTTKFNHALIIASKANLQPSPHFITANSHETSPKGMGICSLLPWCPSKPGHSGGRDHAMCDDSTLLGCRKYAPCFWITCRGRLAESGEGELVKPNVDHKSTARSH